MISVATFNSLEKKYFNNEDMLKIFLPKIDKIKINNMSYNLTKIDNKLHLIPDGDYTSFARLIVADYYNFLNYLLIFSINQIEKKKITIEMLELFLSVDIDKDKDMVIDYIKEQFKTIITNEKFVDKKDNLLKSREPHSNMSVFFGSFIEFTVSNPQPYEHTLIGGVHFYTIGFSLLISSSLESDEYDSLNNLFKLKELTRIRIDPDEDTHAALSDVNYDTFIDSLTTYTYDFLSQTPKES